jgi:exonuclease SbcC
MTEPALNSVSLTNFRSIRGTVTVPLNAPVVLIHGPNGTGKTSVLSAIELALTGDIVAMRRVEPDYLSHLVHHGADEGQVRLSVGNMAEGVQNNGDLSIRAGALAGAPLLSGDLSRFFSERCYLAQATLGRLLEIYNDRSTERESELTRFVRDLLGLDQLDALVEGLHAASDRRNTRNLVPEYGATERAIAALEKQQNQLSRELATSTNAAAGLQKDIYKELQEASILVAGMDSNLQLNVLATLDAVAEDTRLTQLSGWIREFSSLASQAGKVQSSSERAHLARLEAAAGNARASRDGWMAAVGGALETTIDQLREQFADLPSVAASDPGTAVETALGRIRSELRRVDAAIVIDDAAIEEDETLRQVATLAQARIALLTEQLADEAGASDGLANTLTALLPHIDGDDCPVCGRDYSEISDKPLAAQLAAEIARFVERADRVTKLANARQEAEIDLHRADDNFRLNSSRRLSQEVRSSLQVRSATLTESAVTLADLMPGVTDGSRIIRAEAEATRDLASARYRSRLDADLRTTASRLCEAAGLEPPRDPEPLGDALKRVTETLSGEISNLTVRDRARRQVSARQTELARVLDQIDREKQSLALGAGELSKLRKAFAEAESRMLAARNLAKAATATHASIVRRVFNDSLNEIWRDLFVRLAPGEPFVPAFQIPEADSRELMAQLTTSHRLGGQGGSPGAMLSAGNLNTAALTLFLALHLAAGNRLPWLILDDPVQSMDEIHISQFAALLRTLSRQHGRRTVIAVHDRPLFDYLALELSPAYQGDILITVELKRSAEGDSVAEPTFHHWQRDPIFNIA